MNRCHGCGSDRVPVFFVTFHGDGGEVDLWNFGATVSKLCRACIAERGREGWGVVDGER